MCPLGERIWDRTSAVDIRLDHDADPSNPVELYLLVRVVVAVAHQGHVLPLGVVLFVAFGENHVLFEGGGKSFTLGRLLPRVVIESALDVVSVIVVSVEPDVWTAQRVNKEGAQ